MSSWPEGGTCMSTEIDGIQTEFSSRMSYSDYLQLDTLLWRRPR